MSPLSFYHRENQPCPTKRAGVARRAVLLAAPPIAACFSPYRTAMIKLELAFHAVETVINNTLHLRRSLACRASEIESMASSSILHSLFFCLSLSAITTRRSPGYLSWPDPLAEIYGMQVR